MATTTIRCFVSFSAGSDIVTLTPGNAGNNGISLASPNVIEDMQLVAQGAVNVTRFVKGSISTTALQLQEPWNGANLTNVEVRISTSGAAVANLTQAVRDLINTKSAEGSALTTAVTSAQASADAAALSATGLNNLVTQAAQSAQAATDAVAVIASKTDTVNQKALAVDQAFTTINADVTAVNQKATDAAASAQTASQKAVDAATTFTNLQASATAVAAAAAAAATATASAQAVAALTSQQQSTAARDAAIAASQAATAPNAYLPAISQTMHVGTVVATCTSNPQRDTDAGAWVDKCSHTSWENEALCPGTWRMQQATLAACWAVAGAAAGDYYQNSTDGKFYMLGGTLAAPTHIEVFRGNRRKFPSGGVQWFVESSRVVGYDLGTPGCPMWMVFTSGTGILATAGSTPTAYSVAGLNGVLAIGNNATYGALILVDFAADKIKRYRKNLQTTPPTTVNGNFFGGIAQRNSTTVGYDGASYAIVSDTVNAVAMTVLPGAPIDPITGLAVPTIAVLTQGGVSVIKNDGSVASHTFTYTNLYDGIAIDGSLLYYSNASGVSGFRFLDLSKISGSTFVGSPADVPAFSQSIFRFVTAVKQRRLYCVLLSAAGARFKKFNESLPGQSLVADITATYNTGWMVGDIRRCWLADTVAGTITGAQELITNGVNPTTTAGWTAANGGALSVGTNTLKITSGAGGYGAAYQIVTTVVGQTYRVSADATASNFTIYLTASVTVSSGVLGGATRVTNGPLVATFTATTTTTYISFQAAGLSGNTLDLNNISCKLDASFVADRSVKNKPLSVIGTLTKTAVATGAQLVAYSGFSASNYLQEAYSSDLDFSGDFHIPMWVMIGATSVSGTTWTSLFSKSSFTAGYRFFGHLIANGQGAALPGIGGVAIGSTLLITGMFYKIEYVRSGNTLSVYVNGVLVGSTAWVAAFNFCPNQSFLAGVRHSNDGLTVADALTGGSLCLLKPSATAPSADQVAYMYATELQMFNIGAQITLAGTSSTVTALSYDDGTDIMHVSTSYGRSGFKGLVRVDSEATIVGAITSIAAQDGLVITAGTNARVYSPAKSMREGLLNKKAPKGSQFLVEFVTTTNTQTVFDLPPGAYPVKVEVDGIGKRNPSVWSLTSDGTKNSLKFLSAQALGAWVTALCQQE